MATKQVKTQKQATTVPATQKSFEISQSAPDYFDPTKQRGAEGVGVEDVIIPRLELIQGLSPALKKNDPKYIPGAEMGMMNNSVTRELYGDSVLVVPVFYMKQWLVWKDQKRGGGFAGAYDSPTEAQTRADEEGGKKEGWEVLDTPQHLCLLLNQQTGKAEEIMISLPRTKAKVSRAWNSMMRLAGGDTFARVYKVTSAEETNKQGQQYYNFVITPVGFAPEWVYRQAEDLYKRIISGKRKVVVDMEGADIPEDMPEM